MQKMFYVRFSEGEYMSIPSHITQRATVIDDDYKAYKDDPIFVSLYKRFRKAKKDLENYKFNKRHG